MKCTSFWSLVRHRKYTHGQTMALTKVKGVINFSFNRSIYRFLLIIHTLICLFVKEKILLCEHLSMWAITIYVGLYPCGRFSCKHFWLCGFSVGVCRVGYYHRIIDYTLKLWTKEIKELKIYSCYDEVPKIHAVFKKGYTYLCIL